jgi:hypothetical protein
VRGKCTTRLDVYILKEKCLDQREERKAVALFLCRRREKREKREKKLKFKQFEQDKTTNKRKSSKYLI